MVLADLQVVQSAVIFTTDSSVTACSASISMHAKIVTTPFTFCNHYNTAGKAVIFPWKKPRLDNP